MSAPEIAPELVERMVAHFRAVASKYQHVKDGAGNFNDELREVRAIVAELPAPVDPDLIEARFIGDKWTNKGKLGRYANGEWDDRDSTKALVEAIKRGRQLQQEGK